MDTPVLTTITSRTDSLFKMAWARTILHPTGTPATPRATDTPTNVSTRQELVLVPAPAPAPAPNISRGTIDSFLA